MQFPHSFILARVVKYQMVIRGLDIHMDPQKHKAIKKINNSNK